MINKQDFSPIGIGTFGIGGFMEKDPATDAKSQVRGIRHSLEKGLNYLDLSFMYAEGYAVELVRHALQGFDREKIFINAKLGNIESIGDIEKQLDEYLGNFGFDHIDSLQIHSPSRIKVVGIEATSEEIARLTETPKLRFFSVSNFGPKNLELAQKASGNKVFSLENDYSFDVRPCEDIGLLDHCKKHDILFLPFRPVRREGVGLVSGMNYPILRELAEKYNKAETQIILNWYHSKGGVLPLVKSTNIQHIDENIASFQFELSEEDLKRLDTFRVKHPAWENIDWEYEGNGGTKISGLSFVFGG